MTLGMIKYHLLVLWREPLNVFFGLALPFIQLFISIGGVGTEDMPFMLEANFAAWLIIAAMVLSFTDAAWTHAHTRGTKFLRRLRMTPITPKRYLLTGVLSRLGVLILFMVAFLPVMNIFFDENLTDRNWSLFIALLLLAFAMFYLIAMFLANIAKSAKNSESIVLGVFFGMIITLNLSYIPNLPEAVNNVVNVILNAFPHMSAVRLLTSAWIGTDMYVLHFITVIAYTVVFGLLSVKFFRYE